MEDNPFSGPRQEREERTYRKKFLPAVHHDFLTVDLPDDPE